MNIIKFGIACLLWSSVGTWAMAQDYYSPTDKDKEPLARFPLTDLKVETNSEGKSVLSYTLPLELTGRRNHVVLKEASALNSPVRVYEGPLAMATCMGAEGAPGCVVKHKSLDVDPLIASELINKKFADPEIRSAALAISNSFRHSGNEPIGFIGALVKRPDEFQLPKGSWNTYFSMESSPQTVTNSTVEWNASAENVMKPTYTYGAKAPGSFTDIQWQATHVSGRWLAEGQMGWFDFTFDSKMSKFDGYFGFGEPGSPRAGRWFGTISPEPR